MNSSTGFEVQDLTGNRFGFDNLSGTEGVASFQVIDAGLEVQVSITSSSSDPNGGALVAVLDGDGNIVTATNGGVLAQFSGDQFVFDVEEGWFVVIYGTDPVGNLNIFGEIRGLGPIAAVVSEA